MSDHYFTEAAKHCLGMHKGMAGFHECARKNNCMKPDGLKMKRAERPKKVKAPKVPKAKKPKKPKKKPISNEDIQGLLDKFGDIDGSGKIKGGCGSCESSNWIAHVKEYRQKHGCSYKVALSEASKTYH